jgi:hypothetical protein
MIVDIEHPPRPMHLALPQWSAAEVLDAAFSSNLTLRALVCRQAAARWQWCILSIEGARGELISTGIETSAHAARLAATSEITKCVENAFE